MVIEVDAGVEEMVEIFRRDELSRLLEESRELNACILGMEKSREAILKNPNITAPLIHLANQHLEVITESVRQQMFELQKLVKHLEEENMVELQRMEKYHALQKERYQDLESIFPCVLLYIALQRRYPEWVNPTGDI
jgi:hypothetical protein